MKFRPMHDRVVVSPLDAEEKTAGGIIIPDTAQEKPSEGKVISAGPGLLGKKTGKPVGLSVKKGDRVLYTKWSGTEIMVEGKELMIMKESDILGVLGATAKIHAKAKPAAKKAAMDHNHLPGSDCC
ncbi:MAG: co-chaperone GroES [Alphaproteobacteria bacterium]|jgi:chaperonin GroES